MPQPTPQLLNPQYQSVLAAQNADEFKAELVRFSGNLGFRTTNVITVIDRPDAPTQFINVSNVPDTAWHDLDPTVGRRDPLMQHLKFHSTPMVWGPQSYQAPIVSDIYDIISAFGLKSGIGLAQHMPNGIHFYYGVEVDQEQTLQPKQLRHIIAEMQAFSVHACDTAARLFVPADKKEPKIQLSAAQGNILRWILDGSSVSEVADRMNLSQSDTQKQVRAAVEILRCANEHQAALKAVRLMII